MQIGNFKVVCFFEKKGSIQMQILALNIISSLFLHIYFCFFLYCFYVFLPDEKPDCVFLFKNYFVETHS